MKSQKDMNKVIFSSSGLILDSGVVLTFTVPIMIVIEIQSVAPSY